MNLNKDLLINRLPHTLLFLCPSPMAAKENGVIKATPFILILFALFTKIQANPVFHNAADKFPHLFMLRVFLVNGKIRLRLK